MAILLYCDHCKTETAHHNHECVNCANVVKEQKKQEFLKERSKLSIEERLTLIESQLFDQPVNFPKDF